MLTQYLALGGLERMVVSLAIQLQNTGTDCHVLAYESDGLSSFLVTRLNQCGVQTHIIQKNPGFCLRTIREIRRKIIIERISVVHTHDLGALIYGSLAALFAFKKVRIVHTQHSFVHFRKGKKRYSLFERVFSKIASIICAVSPSIKKKYQSLGVDGRRIRVVPNGISFEPKFVDRMAARAKLLRTGAEQREREFASIQEKKWLLFLGRIVPGKGIERLIRLWSELRAHDRPGWALLIVGPVDSYYLEKVLLPLTRLSIDPVDLPVFVGATDDSASWFYAADAFVSLSEEEGMPLSVYEAIGRGLPALLTAIEGHSGVLEHAKVLPIAASPSDQKTLRDFLHEAEQTASFRAELWSLRDSFRHMHSTQRMAADYLEAYRPQSARTRRILTIICLFILNFIHFSSGLARSDQQLTATLEKPEYLMADDFSDNLSIELSPGESRLLILRNNDFCGNLPQLTEESGTPPIRLRWYMGRSLKLTRPSFEGAKTGLYTDALVPLENVVDCESRDIEKVDWLFLEIEVDLAAESERWQLELVSRMRPRGHASRPTSEQRQWLLSLNVLPFKFKEPWVLPLSAEFTPYFAAKAHFGQSDSREGMLTQRYVRSMVEHRILPLKAWIRHPFKNQHEQQDTELLLTRNPSPDLSYARTVASELPSWAEIDLPRIDSSDPHERERYWARWQHFFDQPSEDQAESEFQKRVARAPFVYLWDEPQQEDYNSLREMAESLNTFAPSVSALVTIYPWTSLLDSIRIFVPLLQILEREGHPEISHNHQLWAYVSCMSHGCGSEYSSGEPDFVIERNASYIRVWPWIADHFKLKRVLYYSVNNIWRKSPLLDPWIDQWDFTGNGDGTLFYPGRRGEHGLLEDTPIPSLRMKIWKQASFDAEYIALAKERNPGCFQRIQNELQIVRSAFLWSRETRLYEQARNELIECILADGDSPELREERP
jgi:glycosyltransferase involved in cell wall biosynthesis